jgi:hypothetical protein
MGLYRPQFHALITCESPKQNASSRFYSHTVHAPGLSQTFPDQCASRVRVRDDITFGCGRGFQAAVFLPLVASMRVQQSATPLQIVPGKTLRQALNIRAGGMGIVVAAVVDADCDGPIRQAPQYRRSGLPRRSRGPTSRPATYICRRCSSSRSCRSSGQMGRARS